MTLTKKYSLKTLVALVCGCILLITGLTVFYRINSKPVREHAATVVSAATAQMETWQPTVQATGTLRAYLGTVIKSEVTGRVSQINVKSGDTVKTGDVLLELENDPQKADLDTAKAQLNLNTLNYQRQEQLYPSHAVTKEAVDEARNNYEAGLAAVEKAQAVLDQTIIKAPFDGRVGISDINVGDYLNAGDSIVNLANTDILYVDFKIPEVYMGQLKLGQVVKLVASAYPNKIFTGKVSVLEVNVDANTRSLALRSEINNQDHTLLPGNFVAVTLLLQKKQSVLTVPQTAINYDVNGNYVYQIVKQQVQKTPVKLGTQVGQNIIIESGLNAGDQVVSAGTNKVHEGSLVKIIN